MDMLDRQLEHEDSIPLHIPRVCDTDDLERMNTLLTLSTREGKREVILRGYVANADLYYAAVSAKHPHVLDVDLTERLPTTTTTPAQFLASGLIAH